MKYSVIPLILVALMSSIADATSINPGLDPGPARYKEPPSFGEYERIYQNINALGIVNLSLDDVKSRPLWSYSGKQTNVMYNVIIPVDGSLVAYELIICYRDSDWNCIRENKAVVIPGPQKQTPVWLEADVPVAIVEELVAFLSRNRLIDDDCVETADPENPENTKAFINRLCKVTSAFLADVGVIVNFGEFAGRKAIMKRNIRRDCDKNPDLTVAVDGNACLTKEGALVLVGVTMDDVAHSSEPIALPEKQEEVYEPEPMPYDNLLPDSLMKNLKTQSSLLQADFYLSLKGRFYNVVIRRFVRDGNVEFEFVRARSRLPY